MVPFMTQADADEHARRLAAHSLAANNPTGWFERLYTEAENGAAVVPWDRAAPQQLLVEWAQGRDGTGRRALVVGCGLGMDAEFVAALDLTPSRLTSRRPPFGPPGPAFRTRPSTMSRPTCSTRRPTGTRRSTWWWKA
jgi:hypothetical protein